MGNLELVPLVDRRVSGAGRDHISWRLSPMSVPDRAGPVSTTVASERCTLARMIFETALFETIHHHARFMARTAEAPGWTSQFREIVLSVEAELHDLRETLPADHAALDPDSYEASQDLARTLKAGGSNGVVYPSVRHSGGGCVGLFYPDCASDAVQGRHLDYHWDGARVDLVRDAGTGAVFRLVEVS